MADRVLIVDDDPVQCRLLEDLLSSDGFLCEQAQGGDAAMQRLQRSGAPRFSVVILDLIMPDLDGMAVLERLKRLEIRVPVIVQTATARSESAHDAIRLGAVDFVAKPTAPERLRIAVRNAMRIGTLEGEILRLRNTRSGTLEFRDVIMQSPEMSHAAELAGQASRHARPVLIEGERGVGKEVVARAIHGSSVRRTRPFVIVDCRTLSPAQLESTLSGGVDSGALKNRARPVALGGTLFLADLGALPSSLQERLLVYVAAADRPQSGRAGVRLIAATEQRLVHLVADGRFSQDLFDRFNLCPIWLPPLRDRQQDIPELARTLALRIAAETGKAGIVGLTPESCEMLAGQKWPGNLPQLESAIARAVATSHGGALTPADFLQTSVGPDAPADGNGALHAAHTTSINGVAEQRQAPAEQKPGPAVLAGRRASLRYGFARLLDERGELRQFGMLEEEAIRFAVDHCRGQMSEAARRLGIGRSTLYRKLKDYGILPEGAMSP